MKQRISTTPIFLIILTISSLVRADIPAAKNPYNNASKYAISSLMGLAFIVALWRHYDLSLEKVIDPKKLLKAIRDKNSQVSSRANSSTAQASTAHGSFATGSAQRVTVQDNPLWHLDPEELIANWGYEIIARDPQRRIWQLKPPQEPENVVSKWACGPYMIHGAFRFEKLIDVNSLQDDVSIIKRLSAFHGIPILAGTGTTFIQRAIFVSALKLHTLYTVDMSKKGQILFPKETQISTLRSTQYTHPHAAATIAHDKMTLQVKVPWGWTNDQASAYADTMMDQKLEEYASRTKAHIKNTFSAQNTEPHIAHFGCHVPDHVYLTTVIKFPHEQPIMLVVDTQKDTIHTNALMHSYAHQIADMVGA